MTTENKGASPPIHHHYHPPPPTPPRGRCHRFCWCIYGYIRCCCCCIGCWCSGFWLLLLWALVSLSSFEIGGFDVDSDWESARNTCYHTLHVTPEATQKEIQKSFRKLALKYHPDKAAAEDRLEHEKIFQGISHCYDILGDEDSRKRYDAAGFRETNANGIPFDGDIKLEDIWTFFYEAWKESNDEEDAKQRHWQNQQNNADGKRKNKRKQKRSDSRKNKRPSQRNEL